MADPVILYGPTFGDELAAAGWGGLPISWSPYEIFGRQNCTPEQDAGLQSVINAHDPTKKQAPTLTIDEFISRWTNAEYLALLKKRRDDIAANKIGNAKNWDQVCGGEMVNCNKQKTQSLKADLVTDGILTQARADVIFS